MKREHTNTPPVKAADIEFFDIEELAERLRMDKRTIQRLVRAKKFPAPLEPSPNRRIWSAQVIRDWTDSLLESNPPTFMKNLARLSPEMRQGLIKERIAEILRIGFDSSIVPEDIVIRLTQDAVNGNALAYVDFASPQHADAPREKLINLPHDTNSFEAGTFRLKPGTIMPAGRNLSQLINLPASSGHPQTLSESIRRSFEVNSR